MTRWGLLADIHGNRPALEAALAQFADVGVERIAVLGDNLGRGDSEGCVRLIRDNADVSVRGNRDEDWQHRFDAETKVFVLSLPLVTHHQDVLFSHGDARLTPELSSNDIRRKFLRARRFMESVAAQMWLFGHTHRARVWRLDDARTDPTLLFDAATVALPARIELAPPDSGRRRWIINVGSAGLPFPGKGPTSAAILEWDGSRGWVEFFTL